MTKSTKDTGKEMVLDKVMISCPGGSSLSKPSKDNMIVALDPKAKYLEEEKEEFKSDFELSLWLTNWHNIILQRACTGGSDFMCNVEDASIEEVIVKRVEFGSVHIRVHDITMGDNPCCAKGAPIALDWTYSDRSPLSLDRYERRKKGKNLTPEKLGASQRHEQLLELGFTVRELKKAIREKTRTQRQRRMTKFMIRVDELEEKVCSSGKRLLRKCWLVATKKRANKQ